MHHFLARGCSTSGHTSFVSTSSREEYDAISDVATFSFSSLIPSPYIFLTSLPYSSASTHLCPLHYLFEPLLFSFHDLYTVLLVNLRQNWTKQYKTMGYWSFLTDLYYLAGYMLSNQLLSLSLIKSFIYLFCSCIYKRYFRHQDDSPVGWDLVLQSTNHGFETGTVMVEWRRLLLKPIWQRLLFLFPCRPTLMLLYPS